MTWRRRDGRLEISLVDAAATAFWSRKLNVSAAELTRAISAVGHSTAMVKHWLATHRRAVSARG